MRIPVGQSRLNITGKFLWLVGGVLCALSLLLLAILDAYQQPNRTVKDNPAQVDAAHYHSFWLWGDIPSQPFLSQAQQLYILQGEVSYSHQQQRNILKPQGIGLTQLPSSKIWLVYRTTHLKWSEQTLQQIIKRLNSWQNKGNQVIGLQIDFDSATNQLDQYAQFLTEIRKKLPRQYQLSVTGLMDWTNNQDPHTMNLLINSLDEIVIQTYQGKHTIENYPRYLNGLNRLKIPFKIGLVQHGRWQANNSIEKAPYFKGYVIFLLKD